MARFQACTLLGLILLAVCDGKLLSTATEKLKNSVAKSLAQKRAPGRALEECTGTSLQFVCTGDGPVDTYGSAMYTSADCTGDSALTYSSDDLAAMGSDVSQVLYTTCTDISDGAELSYGMTSCSGGAMNLGIYATNDCSGDAMNTPGSQGDPYACQCDTETTAGDILGVKAAMCFMDCGDDDPNSCDEVADLFAKECASDCTAEDKALIGAMIAAADENPSLALCPTFTGSASTATGLVFAALVSIGALLLA